MDTAAGAHPRTTRGRPLRARLLRSPALWIAVILLVLGAAVALVRSRGPEVRTVVAVRRDIEQHIVASGRVWVPTRVQVAAQSAGWVRTVAVREGDRVSP
jgi:HlyD family secretion protein